MHNYRFKAHTADIRMVIRGGSPGELYIGALEGLNEYMQPHTIRREKKIIHEFKIPSNDDAALLVDFMSHMLKMTLIDRRRYRIKNIHFTPKGNVVGKVTGTSFRGMETEIK